MGVGFGHSYTGYKGESMTAIEVAHTHDPYGEEYFEAPTLELDFSSVDSVYPKITVDTRWEATYMGDGICLVPDSRFADIEEYIANTLVETVFANMPRILEKRLDDVMEPVYEEVLSNFDTLYNEAVENWCIANDLPYRYRIRGDCGTVWMNTGSPFETYALEQKNKALMEAAPSIKSAIKSQRDWSVPFKLGYYNPSWLKTYFFVGETAYVVEANDTQEAQLRPIPERTDWVASFAPPPFSVEELHYDVNTDTEEDDTDE